MTEAELSEQLAIAHTAKASGFKTLVCDIDVLIESIAAARERDELRTRLLSAAGDDLCRLTQEEIKAYTSGEVQIPPEEEFIPSCRQFWRQTADKSGVLKGCLTMAQLIAENEQHRSRIAALESERDLLLKSLSGTATDDERFRATILASGYRARQIAEGK